MSTDGMLNVRDFGAKGDGKSDDTAAIQRALDAAAEKGDTAFVPPGVYLASRLVMQPHTGLVGVPTWTYRDFGGSILRLADEQAKCLVDLTGAFGVTLRGWDGFVMDTWINGNGLAGLGAYEENVAVTMTANRIEWNVAGGIVIHGGTHYNITGNFIDRSGGAGIALLPRGEILPKYFAITGNMIYRSGRPCWCAPGEHDSAHIRLDRASRVTVTGNALTVGRDDRGQGEWSPRFGIVYGGLFLAVIKDNVLRNGALETLLIDLGGHGEGVIVKGNVGSLGVPPWPQTPGHTPT